MKFVHVIFFQCLWRSLFLYCELPNWDLSCILLTFPWVTVTSCETGTPSIRGHLVHIAQSIFLFVFFFRCFLFWFWWCLIFFGDIICDCFFAPLPSFLLIPYNTSSVYSYHSRNDKRYKFDIFVTTICKGTIMPSDIPLCLSRPTTNV